MRRAFPYAALAGMTAGLVAGCPQDPPSFVNLGTESATEGLTEGDQTNGTTGDPTTGAASTSTGGESSTGPAADSTSTGGSSSEDGMGSICGDGLITGNEECDCGGGPCTPEGLGDKTCADAENVFVDGPLTGGVLACNPASCKFDVELCTWCGDGDIGDGENCEPKTPITTTCLELEAGAVGDLNCGKLCQINTEACTQCGAEFNFDECLDPAWFVQLTHGSGATPPSWTCGIVSGNVDGAPPANGETVWATGLDDRYLNSESAAIISPTVDLVNCGDKEAVEMRITHWLEFEGGITNADGGLVQVSNDGIGWTTVTPISGAMYNSEDVLTTAWQPPDGQFGFSGNSVDEGAWVESALDVSSFAGSDSLQVRFVFGSDVTGRRAGWYIDRVEFVGGGA
ncbi:MAG: hypothetical protein JKY37_10240 [Nannocystaceae bacterium]|nr:hypothetical protein [Nannocystaceae bacterium]